MGVSANPSCDTCIKQNDEAIKSCTSAGTRPRPTRSSIAGHTASTPSDSGRTGAEPSDSATDEGRCYVGHRPDSDPARYAVGCDGNDGAGAAKLMLHGYAEIMLGPTSWTDCAKYMRSRNQPSW